MRPVATDRSARNKLDAECPVPRSQTPYFRRDLTICAVDPSNALGAAQRRYRNALQRPMQVGVVSRVARTAARPRVRAKRRSCNIFCQVCALLVEISRSVAARRRTASTQKSKPNLARKPGRRRSEHPTSLISGKKTWCDATHTLQNLKLRALVCTGLFFSSNRT